MLLISIDGNAQSFEADVDFLAYGVVVVDIALINEKRDAAGLILQDDLLEDVAGAIVAAYARLEPEAVGNRHRIFLRGISIARAQVFDGDGLCTAGQRKRRLVERREFVGLVAGGKAQGEAERQETGENLIKMLKLNHNFMFLMKGLELVAHVEEAVEALHVEVFVGVKGGAIKVYAPLLEAARADVFLVENIVE